MTSSLCNKWRHQSDIYMTSPEISQSPRFISPPVAKIRWESKSNEPFGLKVSDSNSCSGQRTGSNKTVNRNGFLCCACAVFYSSNRQQRPGERIVQQVQIQTGQRRLNVLLWIAEFLTDIEVQSPRVRVQVRSLFDLYFSNILSFFPLLSHLLPSIWKFICRLDQLERLDRFEPYLVSWLLGIPAQIDA